MAKGVNVAKRTAKAKMKVKTKAGTQNKRLVLVRYGEIFLKSDPVRRAYTRRLKENLRAGLKGRGLKGFRVVAKRDRLYIEMEDVGDAQQEKVAEVLSKTFGIVSFSIATRLETSKIKDIQRFVKRSYKGWIPKGRKFAVRAKRTGTQKEKYTSLDLAKLVGDVVDRDVDLGDPDVTIFVEVRDDDCYVYTAVLEGPGGMPLGSSGRVLCLLSGGIDSAVSTWMLMKRGCHPVMLYADNYPYIGSRAKGDKRVKDTVKVLQEWSHGWKIPAFKFDHGANLKAFVESDDVPEKFVCLLCKRMMYRMANELAKEWKAMAIVTGESLGEVASQTLDNIVVLDSAAEMPVLRPLIGFDKQETIALAERIGTFKVAKSVKEDCKAVPSTPRTKGKPSELEGIEAALPMKRLASDSVKSVKKMRI